MDLKSLDEPNVEALRQGLPNLEKHLENIKQFKVTPIIAINKFKTDSKEEIEMIKDFAKIKNIRVAVANVWAKGGKGAIDLAQHVIEVVDACKHPFKPLYDWKMPIESKIETIAQNIYGAEHVDYNSTAKRQLRQIKELELEDLPICIAKTQKSLSDNPKLLGRPKDFIITVREIEIASGAGFLIPITGDIMRMPGLPAHPASEGIDISDSGEITGLF